MSAAGSRVRAALIDLPNFAIHAIMMPTGKVLFWGYPPTPEGGVRPNRGEAAIWDPRLGTGPELGLRSWTRR